MSHQHQQHPVERETCYDYEHVQADSTHAKLTSAVGTTGDSDVHDCGSSADRPKLLADIRVGALVPKLCDADETAGDAEASCKGTIRLEAPACRVSIVSALGAVFTVTGTKPPRGD